MHEPAHPDIRHTLDAVLNVFTRRPFTILIPILVGALIGPLLAWIGIRAQIAGVIALAVIGVLMLYLGSATVRRWTHRRIAVMRGYRSAE
jgi:putative Mn2+ efflux pump MntP